MRVKYRRKKKIGHFGISDFSEENRNEVDSCALVLSMSIIKTNIEEFIPDVSFK